MERDDADSCHLTRISRKNCVLTEDAMNKPVMRCEKVEQVLKHCIGRAPEVVESHKEITEEPVDEVLQQQQQEHFGSDNPFLRIPEYVEGQLSAGIESFVEAAEELANDLFGQFGFHRRDEDNWDRHHGWKPPSPPPPPPAPPRRGGSRPPAPSADDDYSEYASAFEEV